jgi:hypothetical protein
MANESAPLIGGEDRDDELIVSRESLSETPQAAIRHTTTSERLGWRGALSPCQKALRTAAILLLIAATLLALLGGPVAAIAGARSAGVALDEWLHPPTPQPMLPKRDYTAIKSPPGSYNLSTMSLAPAVSPKGAAWDCWTTPYPPHKGGEVWTAHAYYTSDGGAVWQKLTLPLKTAQDCTVIADSETAGSALLIFVSPYTYRTYNGGCPAPTLYLTTDTGATWTRVSTPVIASVLACQINTALRHGAIYLWADQPILSDTSPYIPPTGRFIVSRDEGHSWTPADAGLDDSSGFTIVSFRPAGHILAIIADTRTSGSATRMLESDDFGASWRDLGAIPGAFAQVYASDDNTATDHGGWGRLYALARTESHGLPLLPASYTLATAYAGQRWTHISLPPIAPGATLNPQSLQPLALGVGPAGALELERGIIESQNAQLSPSRLLWLWNPIRKLWLLDPLPIPGNLRVMGASWHAGDETLWFTTLQLGVPPTLQISTKAIPVADLKRP